MNRTIPVIAALGLFATSVAAHAAPLTEQQVVESVRRHHPLLWAAIAGRDLAASNRLAAEGRFDTTIRSRFDSDSLGLYENRRLDTWIEQPLAWQGMSFSSGYRLGEGSFAPYDGKLDTRSLGEWRAGMRLPLLRDRIIDSRRAQLDQARLGESIADLSVDQQRLVLLQGAIARYWNWVAAGRRLTVTRAVFEVAERRQQLLEEGVRGGQIPAIEATDNRRAILQRQASLIEAQRFFEQSAIELSLFLRDDAGRIQVPSLDLLPPDFPAAETLDADRLTTSGIATALRRRPELERLQVQAGQTEIDLRLARNSARPAVDMFASFTSEGGTSSTVRRGPQEFRAGLAFEFPFQNRTARGAEGAAQSRLRQFDRQQAFLRDQLEAEVRDAVSALRAAHDRLSILASEVDVSRDLEQAERTRFELGEGTLFVLNLREQATLDAAVRQALAQADYQRARATLRYATGELLDPR